MYLNSAIFTLNQINPNFLEENTWYKNVKTTKSSVDEIKLLTFSFINKKVEFNL